MKSEGMQTLIDLFESFPAHGDRPAVIHRTGVRRLVTTYRDLYADAWREDLRVSRGQTIALKAWIVAGPVTTPNHGWHAMLDAASEFPGWAE